MAACVTLFMFILVTNDKYYTESNSIILSACVLIGLVWPIVFMVIILAWLYKKGTS